MEFNAAHRVVDDGEVSRGESGMVGMADGNWEGQGFTLYMGFEFSSPLRDIQIPKVSCKFTGFMDMDRSLPRCAQPTCAGKSMKRKPQPELQGHGRCRAMPPRSRVMSRMPRRARRKGGRDQGSKHTECVRPVRFYRNRLKSMLQVA